VLSNVSLRWLVHEVLKANTTSKPNEVLRKPKFEILFNPTTLEWWNIPQREIWSSTARELSNANIVEDAPTQKLGRIYAMGSTVCLLIKKSTLTALRSVSARACGTGLGG